MIRKNSMQNKFWAAGLVVVLLGVGYFTRAAFRGDYLDTVTIAVETPRSGLAMQSGALVKRHGVAVGRVTEVIATEEGAVLWLAVQASEAVSIPQNSNVNISPSTVFGAKTVQLIDPPNIGASGLRDGMKLLAASVTVEVNSIFAALTKVLNAVAPEKLATVLSVISGALRGNGASIGSGIDELNTVLAQVNSRMPALSKDIEASADTSKIYADAADDLMKTLVNFTPTAQTITSHASDFDAFLLSAIGLGDSGTKVLSPNSGKLVTAIQFLRPTAELLNEYSPVITCLLKGADVARKMSSKVSGGDGVAMLLNSTFLFGVEPYKYAKDLQVVRAKGGPRCGALPVVKPKDVPTPYVVANTGTNPFENSGSSPQIVPGSILQFLLGGGWLGKP